MSTIFFEKLKKRKIKRIYTKCADINFESVYFNIAPKSKVWYTLLDNQIGGIYMIKYFKRFAIRTGYDVFSYFSLIVMIATYLLPVIFIINNNMPFAIFSFIGIVLANILRNQRLASFGNVVFVTFIQLICGPVAPLILIVKIIMRVLSKTPSVSYEANCWAGERRYDDDRAREYGYKSVDDAIEAGVMFDGTKLW